MTITQEIGTRIRRIRINKDHTQDDMAKALDLTVGAYAKIERGETDPSATRLFELAKILKVDIVAFLKDEVAPGVSTGGDSTISRAVLDGLQNRVGAIEKKLGIKTADNAPVKKSVARKVNKR
jgi:transcriptional regulator with XRE-family HTH domain